MNEIDDLPPVKDFGPEASLRRRRIWGVGLMIVVLTFFDVVTFVLGDGTNYGDGCMNFSNSTNEKPPVWLFHDWRRCRPLCRDFCPGTGRQVAENLRKRIINATSAIISFYYNLKQTFDLINYLRHNIFNQRSE